MESDDKYSLKSKFTQNPFYNNLLCFTKMYVFFFFGTEAGKECMFFMEDLTTNLLFRYEKEKWSAFLQNIQYVYL